MVFAFDLCIFIDVKFNLHTGYVNFATMTESSNVRHAIAIALAFGLFIFVNIQNQFDWIVFFDPTRDTTLSPISVSTSVRVYHSAKLASFLLSAFLVLRFDSTKMLSIGIAGSSIVNLIIPVTAASSEILFILICVCKGIFEGMIFPYFMKIMSYWAPVKENSTLVAISLFGYLFGHVISSSIGISLSGTNVSVPFYVFGALGICWTILWLIVVKEKPSEHPKVSPSELQNITADEKEGELITTLTRDLIKAMFRRKSTISIYVVALAIAFNTSIVSIFNRIGINLSTFELDPEVEELLQIQRLIISVAHTSIFSNLAATFSVVIMAAASDYFRRHYSITKIRKCTICFALIGSAVLLPFLEIIRLENVPVTVPFVLTGLFIILQGILLHGYLVNALDVVYRAAGHVIGISFGVAGALSETALWIMMTFAFSINSLEPMFYMAMGLNVLACIVYALCGSATRENWITYN